MSNYTVRTNSNYIKCPVCGNKDFYDISAYLHNPAQHVLVCKYCSYHLNFGAEFPNTIHKKGD